ncbi:MAG: type II secretion system protein GspJ [Sandaracinaceae bacterium]|nr:MAG: prepilin-type N-terminal cleavage/methylation domain-containing protein [Sandaracinaceae bacterium]HBQ11267.1 general secretion pathway protein GspJ [Myxococcales bacterium]
MRRTLKGMTLIEIMVAVTILAIVSTVIFGGFSTTMRNKARVEQMADRSHVIRVAMERMVAELSQAYVSIQVNPNPALQMMNTCFIGGRSGRGHRVDFTSFSHRRLYRDAHESDQNELSYFMTSHPEDPGRYVLARREDNRPDDDPQSGGTTMILVDDVLDFEVEYFDIATSEWSETWDTREITAQPNRLPVQVKISLTVPDERASSRRRTFVTRAEPRNTWALNHAIYIAR